jgi:hypothetical protein
MCFAISVFFKVKLKKTQYTRTQGIHYRPNMLFMNELRHKDSSVAIVSMGVMLETTAKLWYGSLGIGVYILAQ